MSKHSVNYHVEQNNSKLTEDGSTTAAMAAITNMKHKAQVYAVSTTSFIPLSFFVVNFQPKEVQKLPSPVLPIYHPPCLFTLKLHLTMRNLARFGTLIVCEWNLLVWCAVLVICCTPYTVGTKLLDLWGVYVTTYFQNLLRFWKFLSVGQALKLPWAPGKRTSAHQQEIRGVLITRNYTIGRLQHISLHSNQVWLYCKKKTTYSTFGFLLAVQRMGIKQCMLIWVCSVNYNL